MNPFTRFLTSRSGDRHLNDFVQRWDRLEALVIRIYKSRQATAEDETEYGALKRWLEARYPRWQARLQPYWQEAQAGGEVVRADPFVRLLAPEAARSFIGDWAAMQQLPAAREALNRYILAVNRQ